MTHPEPPIDMKNVVLPFIRPNGEYITQVDANGDYYKFVGTKSESHFWFTITSNERDSSSGRQYLLVYVPLGTGSSQQARKRIGINKFQLFLDHWLTMIKNHRALIEGHEVEQQPAPIQELVSEIEATTSDDIEYSNDEIIQLIHDKHKKGIFRLNSFLKSHGVKADYGQSQIIMQILRDGKFIDESESIPGDFSITIRYLFVETIKEHGSWNAYIEHKKSEKEKERKRLERKDAIDERMLDKLGYEEEMRPIDEEVKLSTIMRNWAGTGADSIKIGVFLGGALVTIWLILSALLKSQQL